MPEVKQEQSEVGGASESIVHVEDYGRHAFPSREPESD